MNRRDFQSLARIRLREAQALLETGHFSGAYYLAGYAVECALKACIAKRTRAGDFPDLENVRLSWTHNPNTLVRAAGLVAERDRLLRDDSMFAQNWGTVKDWSETSRYNTNTGEDEVRELLGAILNEGHGVLPWLRRHW